MRKAFLIGGAVIAVGAMGGGLIAWLGGGSKDYECDGQEARKHELPWSVGLFQNRFMRICSGVIYSDEWILTAAHCAEESGFQVGIPSDDHSKVTLVDIDAKFVHSEYDPSAKLKDCVGDTCPTLHDIAVMKINRKVALDRTIKVIGDDRSLTHAVVSSWTCPDPSKRPSIVKMVEPEDTLTHWQADIVINEGGGQCKKGFEPLPASMICAPRGRTRSGDSGGSLSTQVGKGAELIGLLTNDDSGTISVFLRASSYADWITACARDNPTDSRCKSLPVDKSSDSVKE